MLESKLNMLLLDEPEIGDIAISWIGTEDEFCKYVDLSRLLRPALGLHFEPKECELVAWFWNELKTTHPDDMAKLAQRGLFRLARGVEFYGLWLEAEDLRVLRLEEMWRTV